MKKSIKMLLVALVITLPLLGTNISAMETTETGITFIPVEHGSLVIQVPPRTIYVDPAANLKKFEKLSKPDIFLYTHLHPDHFDLEVLDVLKQEHSHVVGPDRVIDKLKEGLRMKNGDTITVGNIGIEAVPMYNLTVDRAEFHLKNEGNGYVITANDQRIYISGDTEDTPEMRNLKNIDYAFVCMNLPYTMTVEQAADAILQMKPRVVYPYHYRGKDKKFSDLEKFKSLVNEKEPDIQVKVLDWYENQ